MACLRESVSGLLFLLLNMAINLSFKNFDIVQILNRDGQIRQGIGQPGMVYIGGGAAVLGQLDIGMLQDIVFLVHHRAFAPDEQQGKVVVQGSHLVGGHQLPAGLLVADGAGAVRAAGHTSVAGIQSLLAQQFGDVFMGGLLVSTQVNQRIGIAHQALPIILEQGFEGRDILKDDGRHDIAGAHGGLELAEVVRQRYIAELVHHQPDRDGQGTLVYLVGLVIEGLKGTGIEHPHQIVEGAVIVGDDGKHGLFALTHEAQLHIVPRRDTGDLGQDEGGEPHCGGYQDRLGGFARNELSRTL